MSEWVNQTVEDGLNRYTRVSFWEAGVDEFTDPPAQPPESFGALNNVIVGSRPRITRRPGTTLFANPVIDARRIFETHFTNGRNRFVLTAANGTGASGPDNKVVAIDENGSVTAAALFIPSATPAAGSGIHSSNPSVSHPHVTASRDYVYFSDGVAADLLRWNTEDDAGAPLVQKWGIETPVAVGTNDACVAAGTCATTGGSLNASASAEGSGNVHLVGGRAYTVIYRNSVTGSTSDICPNFTNAMGITSDPSDPATGVTITLSSIPVSADPQVDEKVILATSDGGAQDTLYEVAVIPNATTTVDDNLAEENLLNQNIWAELGAGGRQIGVIGATTPIETAPTATLSVVFRGRMLLADGHFLKWSRNQAEMTTSTNNVTGRWEEAFPIENQAPISANGAEIITSLRTDDMAAYIGTNRAVYVLDSDNPGFNPPRALFQEVGVLNNYVWSTIYHSGTAVGAMWVTPDKRVIKSNFATYEDVGNAIQTSLSAWATTTRTTATSTFVADAEHEWYMLAPGGAALTVHVYNVKTNRWMKWFSFYANDAVRALGYMYDNVNERTLPVFATTSQRIYRWNRTTVYDHSAGGGETPALPAPSMETNWLGFGAPEAVKALSSIEVHTDEPSMTVTVYGARTENEFETPANLGTLTLTTNPFGQLWAPLCEMPARYRFYKFSFGGLDDSTETDVLSYVSIEYSYLSAI